MPFVLQGHRWGQSQPRDVEHHHSGQHQHLSTIQVNNNLTRLWATFFGKEKLQNLKFWENLTPTIFNAFRIANLNVLNKLCHNENVLYYSKILFQPGIPKATRKSEWQQIRSDVREGFGKWINRSMEKKYECKDCDIAIEWRYWRSHVIWYMENRLDVTEEGGQKNGRTKQRVISKSILPSLLNLYWLWWPHTTLLVPLTFSM